jgi:chaperonin GroES
MATAMSTKITPLGDRVVVKALELEEKTRSGIVLPDTAKEKPQEGEVVATGEGRTLDSGEKVAVSVEPGQRILFAKYAGTEIKLGDDEYLILSEKDVLAILE